jgi:hypothetical protein
LALREVAVMPELDRVQATAQQAAIAPSADRLLQSRPRMEVDVARAAPVRPMRAVVVVLDWLVLEAMRPLAQAARQEQMAA